MINRFLLFNIFLSLTLSGNLLAQEVQTRFTLFQLIDSALLNNYLLQASRKNKLIKQAELEILKTNYQPKISTSASFSFWKFLLPNKQKVLGDALTDVYTDVSIYQTIYDWGENKAKKSIVEEEIKVNDEIQKQIRNTIIWGVSDAYFEVLKAESEISVHKNALQQLKSHLQYAENLYKIGRVSGVDVLKINVQISVEEKNMQKAQNARLNQLIKIKRLCYLKEEDSFDIENISETLYKETRDLSFSPYSLYDTVIQNHPVLLASNGKINIEAKQKDVYMLQNQPELFTYGITSWENAYIPFGDNFNYNIGVGIRYTIPYWGGGSYKSKIVQSKYRIEQMYDEQNQTFLDIKKEIDIALNTINDIKSEIVNNEKIISLTNETLNNALVKYQAGQGTIIDILDGQTILTETSIAYNKTIINYLQTLVKLHYLTGNDDYPF
ncbi:MAG: TolC family protein [Prolixibacteraceae bacterium]|nr:TolC family protein [Prolixibacteraceae bacterium]